MSFYIFNGLIYHQRTLRNLENHTCSFSTVNVGPLVNLIHFMHNPSAEEYPNHRVIVEKRFYINIDD